VSREEVDIAGEIFTVHVLPGRWYVSTDHWCVAGRGWDFSGLESLSAEEREIIVRVLRYYLA
jgi:hypothetical protein